jgi:hypothetical protein
MAHIDIESVLSIGCSAAATEKIARHAGTILTGRTAELEAESAIGQSLDVGSLIALFLLAEPAGGGTGEPNKGVKSFIGSRKYNKINGSAIGQHRFLAGFADMI